MYSRSYEATEAVAKKANWSVYDKDHMSELQIENRSEATEAVAKKAKKGVL